MSRRTRALGIAAFAGAAVVGTALGYAAERRLARGQRPDLDPEWSELHRDLGGRPAVVPAPDETLLHAEVLGSDDAPSVVLVHGFGLAQGAWHYQRRDLSDAYRVVTFDTRGHGRSEPAATGDYSAAALGGDLAAVLDAAVPAGERALVVGHSLGGMTIMALADRHPEVFDERVAGAVLLSTTAADPVGGALLSSGLAAAMAAQRRLVAAGFGVLGKDGRLSRSTLHASSDLSLLLTRAIGLSAAASPAHVAFTEELLIDCPNPVLSAFGPTLSALDLSEALDTIKVPTLVMVGRLDRLTPIDQSRRLVEQLADAELVDLPGVGHMALLEAHDVVTAHLRRFAHRILGEGG